MSKTQYQIQCRAEFDAMIEERATAKRARRPVVVPHAVVTVTLLRSPAARLPTLAKCHLAADKLIAADSAYAETCARLDAELVEMLNGRPSPCVSCGLAA
jgi:hypothetical protein